MNRQVFSREDLTAEELTAAKRSYEIKAKTITRRRDKNGLPIEMLLTFDEWLDIWLASGQLLNRGLRRGQYVMSRDNDLGHYEVGNAFIQLASDNSREGKFGQPSSIKGRVSPTKGMRQSEESNEKRRLAKLKLHKKPCPHCLKAFDPAAFSRYHGSRCKEQVKT